MKRESVVTPLTSLLLSKKSYNSFKIKTNHLVILYEKNFYKENIEYFASLFEPIEECSKYVKLLKEEGNTIYIISGRDNGEYKDPYTMTKKWLDSHNIYYDNLILTNAYNKHEKSEKCIENNIELLIDDSISNCLNVDNLGIDTIIIGNKNDRGTKTRNSYNRLNEKP